MHIASYRDLKVWQIGMNLAAVCYEITSKLPGSEVYGLTSQTRRAAASFPANIAEGYGRESRGEFIQFLRIAQGSLKELETHLLLAERLAFLQRDACSAILLDCEMLGKMLRALIRKLQAKKAAE
jgi:four helix bundle protein